MCQKTYHIYANCLNPSLGLQKHIRWSTPNPDPKDCAYFHGFNDVQNGIFVQGTGEPCTAKLQVRERTPDFALDCLARVWGMLDRSSWFLEEEGMRFVRSGAVNGFLRGGLGGWWGKSLI